MPSSFRRPLLALTAATGGLLAALSSSAVSSADVWTIYEYPGDPAEVVSVSGMPPYDQTIVEQGPFDLTDSAGNPADVGTYPEVDGVLTSTSFFGVTNQDFVSNDVFGAGYAHSVIDVMSFGDFHNDYSDLVGVLDGGKNLISDTLVTPFGNFDIPTTFDAAVFGPSPVPAAAEASPADIVTEPIVGDPGFDFVPDPDDGSVVVTSTAGFAPLYTTVQEQGTFVTDSQLVFGNASFYSDMFGDHSQLFDRFYNGEVTQVIDQFNFGNSGFENIYDEVVGAGANGTNSITDTFVTPFGDFNIPTTYDAAALLEVGGVAPGAATDWLGALEADWTTLVTDFSALF